MTGPTGFKGSAPKTGTFTSPHLLAQTLRKPGGGGRKSQNGRCRTRKNLHWFLIHIKRRAPFTSTPGVLSKHKSDNGHSAVTKEPTVIMVTRCALPTCHSLRLLTLLMHEIIHPDRAAPTFMPTSNMASSHYPLGHKSTWRGVINENLIKPGGTGYPRCPVKVKLPLIAT